MTSATPRPLLQKLGFVPGRRSLILHLPSPLTAAFAQATDATAMPPDWLIGFARDQDTLAQVAATLIPAYPSGGHLWFAYPKISGGLPTDITRDRGWAAVSGQGLLPVTQVALDAIWSALRFRHRDEIKTLTRKTGI